LLQFEFACFGCGFHPKCLIRPVSLDRTSVPAKWHLNPSNCLSRAHECDRQLPTRDIGYVPPTDTGSLCLAVDSTHTVVGLFRLLVRRSGTRCQMNSEIRRVMSTASSSSVKQSCSALTSVTSALEVIFNVMRSINPCFTYLLTYSQTTDSSRYGEMCRNRHSA